MINFYVKKILRKEITIDDVPLHWKSNVQKKLDEIAKK